MHLHSTAQAHLPSSLAPSVASRSRSRLPLLTLGLSALGVASSLGLMPAAQAGGSSFPPCVPVGDCVYYSFCRPPLPPGAEWAGGGSGDPVAYENDAFSDDFLGRTSGSGDPACVLVCNHGGDLYSYPLGVQLNGPGEFGTPEIFVRWTATYTSTVTTTTSNTSGSSAQDSSGHAAGSSSTTGVSMTSSVLRYATVRSGDVEVWSC